MDKIETMKRFVAVAQTGSFTSASEQLNVPKSAISTSVSRLEDHLNTRLLHRSTRRVSLTEAGERYYPQCLALLTELEGLETQFQGESAALSGVLKLDMPSRFFSTLVAPHLTDWFARYPDTQIRLLGADYRIDPIKEQVDCVIRAGKLQDSEMIARPLGEMTMLNCVSPSYIERFGTPLTLAHLSEHYVVDYAPSLRQPQLGFEYYADGQTHYVKTRSFISVSTTDAYLSACLNGLGIIQLPASGVEQQIRSGELIEVLSDYRCESMPIAALYPSRRQQPKRLSEFLNWLSSIIAQHPRY
ncbi:DNA-binding transcriptional regulator, LysR family [Vibrio xiamenensis]|uniref:DNA-binding transcriptional regulator, LysR family n=1 Tax=Vibrio xiamenensis TaxID=861298 RepID=A0A1G7XUZ4_9VIBR|nr:LysR family transcriptional regulator [Vibrio xiamenensis]SDG76674.1 DNA-binding transcriptional regulator, LysR family [Vibrio xiamenensis]SDG87991.1 DNA-binding transcriptional regulator, LysR family [Vibrio xiamenensis]